HRGIVISGKNGGQRQGEVPVIAVIVEVVEPVAGLLERFIQAHLLLRGALPFPFLRVEGAQEPVHVRAERVAPEREGMQVVIPPVEGRLDDGVHLIQREVGAHVQLPPDLGGGIVEAHPQAIHVERGERGPAQGNDWFRSLHPATVLRQRGRRGPFRIRPRPRSVGEWTHETFFPTQLPAPWPRSAPSPNTSPPRTSTPIPAATTTRSRGCCGTWGARSTCRSPTSPEPRNCGPSAATPSNWASPRRGSATATPPHRPGPSPPEIRTPSSTTSPPPRRRCRSTSRASIHQRSAR